MHKKTVFAIGVIGGLVGYACGVLVTPGTAVAQQEGASSGSAEAPPHDAGAASTSPSTAGPTPPCQQWEVKLLPDNGHIRYEAVTIPEGWEPFAFRDSFITVVRRCIR